ncbi:hypothetical protein AHAS_Ahas02G0015800 [Arachis hypogaea]
MAGALVGGAFLSGFINVVFDRLLTKDAVNLVLGKKLGPDLVERLKTALLGAEALVADAELKQFGKPLVRKWLDSLRDAVYCAEDLLDAVLLKATTQKNASSSWSLSFFINRDREMVDKMEVVVRRIEDLGKQKDFLGLEKIPTGSSSWRTPSTSLVKGHVYGREDDQEALKKMLNGNNEHHLSVIAIVGIGGVGKTTLAQWLYNNEGEFMKGFDLKAWVCVSEEFEVVETTRNVIKQLHGGTCSLDDFNSLQNALKEELSNKKFFIVLDDVWSDDGDKWSNFMTPFQQNGNKGSIVLLTTREENVASAVQNCRPYFLKKLSEEYCWSVFAENASFTESNGKAALEEIGRKIVKKCDGLPLAAETLGRLLRTKHDVEEWNKILMSHIWGFSVEKKDLLPPPKRGESLEEVGLKSLRTLLFSGFSSPNCNIETATCEILSKCKYLRVLSLTKLDEVPNLIGEFIYLRYLDLSWTDIKTLPESLCNLCNLQTLKLRRCYELTMLPSGLHNLVSLRHLDIRETALEEMPRKMSKLNQLHVLSSFVVGKHEDNGIQELGGLVNLHGSLEIKKMENIVDVKEAKRAKIMDKKHIDELCLKWSSGEDLVSSTQKERDMLDNLQPHKGLKELKIEGYKGTIFPDWLGNCSYENMTRVSLESCKNCCMLPSLGQLPSLKSLRIKGLDQLRSIGEEFYENEGDHHSSHIAPFPSLETLVFYNMACWKEWHLPDSKAFPQLRKLEIRNCPMLKEEMLNRLFFRIVSSLPTVAMYLDEDTLSIGGSESVMESAFNAKISINHLRWLPEIFIQRCRKLEFPQLQQQKYDLVDLRIHSCDSLTSLSLDVFPNLKNLNIFRCRNLESVSMSEAPHAALKEVTIIECDKLVSFAGEGLAAPNLTHLYVSGCSKLEALPRDMKSLLPSLQSLEIYDCPNICRLPEGGLQPNLKSLSWGIGEQQMRDLSWMPNLHALTHLTIHGSLCENIKSYPEIPVYSAKKSARYCDVIAMRVSYFKSNSDTDASVSKGLNKFLVD